jgi:hypothetical protein
MKETKQIRNIQNFKPSDLSGNEIEVPELSKLLGNALYFGASDISVCDIAKKIYNQEDFEVTEQLIASIPNLQKTLAPWLISQFEDWLK